MVRAQTLASNKKKLVADTVKASVNQDLEANIIKKLREELFSKRHEIANQVDDNAMYLVQLYPDYEWTPDVPFVHIVAVEVSDFTPLPEEFIQHTIPAGTYVKATHHGPESKLAETYDAIHEKGINNTRPFDFEYWVDIHSLDQEDSTIDIYLPVEG
jgi:predicted transcriptional regulator YdeE